MEGKIAVRFQDRKLNKCAQCGTQKQLAPYFTVPDGKMYFLCRSHAFILDEMEKKIAEATETLNRR